MVPADLEDVRWLLGEDAGRWLDRLARDRRPLTSQAAALRREVSSTRAHLLLQQVELRSRGAAKFSTAERMFFTPVGLEQATDEAIACCKSARFPQGAPVADLCCGIGGDLLGLCGRGPATGIDRDPVAALLAQANVRIAGTGTSATEGVVVRRGSADSVRLGDLAAWHIDPDRRPTGRRTTRVALHEPGPDTIDRLLQANGQAAVKLAPAAHLPENWPPECELEWISRGGECRQLVAWFGRLAERPAARRATVVMSRPGQPVQTAQLVGQAMFHRPGSAEAPRRYVLEPDPAVLAAGLSAALADRHGLAALGPWQGYLTGDEPIAVPLAACFEVLATLPFDLRRLRGLLAARGVGRLEVKTRGVRHVPDEVRKRLRLRGDRAATLILTRVGRRVLAIVCQRRSPAP